MKNFTCNPPYERTEKEGYQSMIGGWSVKVERIGLPPSPFSHWDWYTAMMDEVKAWMAANGMKAVVHGDNIFTLSKDDAFLFYLAFK